jgi:mediator of RNA polymerase II transcription subunit 14
VESNAVGLSLSVVRFPACPGLEEKHSLAFARLLLSASIRRRGGVWVLEWVLAASPLQAATSSSLYSQFELETVNECEKTVTAILGEWNAMVQLHSLVGRLHRYLSAEAGSSSSSAPLESVTVKSYNYRSLQLEYGPRGLYTVSVAWKWPEGRFALTFGGTGTAASMNPHTLFRNQLEIQLNRERDLALLCKLLSETVTPALSLCRLPPTPHRGMSINQRNAVHQTFAILPQTPSHVKINFYGKYCVDVHFRAEGLVSVRDGVYSMFDQIKVLEELQPIPGFKAFLSKYVDEAAFARRTSQTEDDNPPSPLTMDTAAEGGGGGKQDVKFSAAHGGHAGGLNPVSPHGGGASSFLQSPPSMGGRQPSPAMPGAAPSPAAGSPFTSVASPLGGSPRSRPSPRNAGTSPKPASGYGSSSYPPTQTRILPQRLWAAAIPTLLTSKAFDDICRYCTLQVFISIR